MENWICICYFLLSTSENNQLILNFGLVSKNQGSEKFRQRAYALRRVSVMLLIIALFKGKNITKFIEIGYFF